MDKATEYIGFSFLGLYTLAVGAYFILLHFGVSLGFFTDIYYGSFLLLTAAIAFFTVRLWRKFPYVWNLIGFLILLAITWYVTDVIL